MWRAAIAWLTFSASAAHAIELAPSGARLTATEGPIADSVILPRGAYSPDAPPDSASGIVTRRSWRLPGRSDTPLQIAAPIEAQLAAQGYQIVFSCSDADCGGFDFRFQLSLLPAPAMFVDLGDYRYVLAETTGEDGTRLVSIVTSRAGEAGTLHITEVVPLGTGPQVVGAKATEGPKDEDGTMSASPPGAIGDDLIARLETTGHVVLTEIDFPSGAATLPTGDYPDLDRLADWLTDTPTARVVLVGHTDAVGSLAANTDLSRRRAGSVAARLAELAPTAAGRITSAGAGYLSPIASNLTDEGRAANRRVEVVLLER